jgi:ubiquinone/menaquinone biosynthesis C-methylase UbiE
MLITLARTPGRLPFSKALWQIQRLFESKTRSAIAMPFDHTGEKSEVDQYWGRHTVTTGIPMFLSRGQSRAVLRNRYRLYPQFKGFMDLYGDHSGKTVLDYGCGPGNDLLGFATESNAARIIGVDISPLALHHARERLSLHAVDPNRIALHLVSDRTEHIPLPDNSVDHLYCGGVLMHTSHPEANLREFYRVMKPGATGYLMVYHRDSVWFHLYVPYVVKIVRGEFTNLPDDLAFQRTTDGPQCPLARCYTHQDFMQIIDSTGLSSDFVGGYLSVFELWQMKRFLTMALNDPRLAEEHRTFLKEMTFDSRGFPMYRGYHAGIGGVYRIRKA